MPTGHDPTRLKLGASATWSKLKYQSHQYTSKITQNSINQSLTDNDSKFIEFGINGEIFIVYKNSNIIEVWDWKHNVIELNELDQKNIETIDSNDVLYLVASNMDSKGIIINITPIKCDQLTNTYTVLITSIISNETNFTIKTFGQIFQEDFKEIQLILPPLVYGMNPYTIKNSENFIGIATNQGSLTIFDLKRNHPLPLELNCSIINDQCMFSIAGRILAYVPNLNQTSNSIDLGAKELEIPINFTNGIDEMDYYSKLLNNLSIKTIDGLISLSDFKNLQKNFQSTISKGGITQNFKLILSNLLSQGTGGSQYIIFYDLLEEKQIGYFKPPNGISQLSLSSYNSQLITISSRGDEISNWDISQAPREIHLIDLKIRGKTSSIVTNINWSNFNNFQIITKKTGSLHNLSTSIDPQTKEHEDWILSNLGLEKVINLNNSNQWLLGLKPQDSIIYLIDSHNQGSINFEFKLPSQGISKALLPNHIKLSIINEKIIRVEEQDSQELDPLSQIEIESSLTLEPFNNSKRINMGHYQIKPTPKEFLDSKTQYILGSEDIDELDVSKGVVENFKKIFKIMGNPIGYERVFDDKNGEVVFDKSFDGEEDDTIDCGSDGNGGGNGNGVDGLNEALNDVLVLDGKE
ncbi:hypothetical protein BN7_2711 [Wickerhamomyces ciferrii]|uniref:Uncharacterized protein n=1 Tax=Wickerhamomyces ciferrii (strain ATCC 14091 / BCRC 22168 / CBS 111 / JCM 3599 / NBRC 0793 / NRRL Y-1031 F-60-10) TaxID=1206466 RepID=K0KP49_WICCF|nr:uncharacterized protein BN7_2711 [Wickerhamomyces ciferrii]CCH43164.1 hypothetical protein BN7_2711 [Wickerhamomyces ciferrii]